MRFPLLRMAPQLEMVRENLENLPPIKLPSGYRLRSYYVGAGKDWNRIVATAFDWDPKAVDYFETRIHRDPFFQPNRVIFILRGRKAVATASAWHNPLQSESTGIVHFVAVGPDDRGKSLGQLVSLAALHQMVAEGRSRAWLQTDDDRLPAIKSYLKLGFVPKIIHANQKKRWQTILRLLKPGSGKKGTKKLSVIRGKSQPS